MLPSASSSDPLINHEFPAHKHHENYSVLLSHTHGYNSVYAAKVVGSTYRSRLKLKITFATPNLQHFVQVSTRCHTTNICHAKSEIGRNTGVTPVKN